MPKIPAPIPDQNFKLISERVGLILTDELSLHDPDVDVFLERIVPIDKSEVPAINIMYSGSKYTANDRSNSDSSDVIFIDVYIKAVGTDVKRGDELASEALKVLLGKIRYILESPLYETLDFTPGLIRRSEVESINTFQPEKVGDGINGVTGRVNLRVDASETVALGAAKNAEGYTTNVKLEETDKGYQFIINN